MGYKVLFDSFSFKKRMNTKGTGNTTANNVRGGQNNMEQLTTKLEENQQALDVLLGVGRNYDVISRDLYIGQWKGRL